LNLSSDILLPSLCFQNATCTAPRRWELDRQQKEAAWAEQQLLLAREKEQTEYQLRAEWGQLRAETDGKIREERARMMEQQSALDAVGAVHVSPPLTHS
jgi:hypothetical protein